jgi:hypothetical protein
MAWSLLIHACLPDTFWFHTLQYVTHIFNVLPIKGLVKKEEMASIPHKLMTRRRLLISQYCVFGCPTIIWQ